MDVSLVISHRLNELGLEQRDLATPPRLRSPIFPSQQQGKKPPPTARQTTISEKRFLFSHLLTKQYKTQFGHVGDILIERVTILHLDRIKLT